MTEDLLTPSEIKEIQEEAKKPKYAQTNLVHLGKDKTSIFRISPTTGLILINGNEWTGREHIDIRHSPSSRMPYWDENDKLENQSKFHLGLPPIAYLSVADQVYKTENFNKEKNKRPEVFDLFIGNAQFNNLPETEYTLVIYKDTKIIHSFFVSSNKKPFNKKKIIDLRQGWANSSWDLMAGIETFTIPYFDRNSIERFKIILKTDRVSATDNWFVQMNDEQGTPVLTTGVRVDKINSTLETPFRMKQLDYSKLDWIEKLIKKMLEGKYDF
ncbi:hypothetical protein AAOE16_18030 [Ekhidna sp. MALMAid0563]|uniref:hypothetical protein n=1 Tax=Ekhidna sp. MALMAid0563 TaxID=3143937 RepID=UPI0032DF9E98